MRLHVLWLVCLVANVDSQQTNCNVSQKASASPLSGVAKLLLAFSPPVQWRPLGAGLDHNVAVNNIRRATRNTEFVQFDGVARLVEERMFGCGLQFAGKHHSCSRRGAIVLAQASVARPPKDVATAVVPPPTALLMLIAGLQAGCFGCIGTALPPALRASGLEPAAVALLLGRLGSASAFCEVMLSGSFGKLADAIGRKPILLVAPAITILARALVVLDTSVNVLVGVRFMTTLAVPIFWLAYQAMLADCFGNDATKLAVTGSRIQAAMGLGYAMCSIVGGYLAAIDIRYAYAGSCFLGACVLVCNLFIRETLPDSRKVPFQWKAGFEPLAFTSLFRRGVLSTKLNTVVVLQSLTNGMGDLWQVLARELRGWGAAQCGRFAAFVGVGAGLGTLLTSKSIRRFGARGHTVVTTASSAVGTAILGKATSNAIAYGAILPVALGAGKTQATTARIVNLGDELGVPQGQLAAERNALNAIIKVIAPSLYAWLFAIGASGGILGLPFYATSLLLTCSALMAASIPAGMWQSQTPETSLKNNSKNEAPIDARDKH